MADARTLAHDDELLRRITVSLDDGVEGGGRPIIRGTTVTVGDILIRVAHGFTTSEVVADLPALDPEDVSAALLYVARAWGDYVPHATWWERAHRAVARWWRGPAR